MKKVLAVLAVLAVAAAAQAELLASWGSNAAPTGTQGDDGYYYQANGLFGVKDLAAVGGNSTTGSATGQNNYDIRVAGNQGIKFEYNATEDLAGVRISGTIHATAAAAKDGLWYVGEANTDKITSTVTTFTSFDSSLGDISKGSGTIKFQADTESGRVSGTGSISGNYDFRGVEVNGVAAVPEPATMSLLGLGALAMALRRKPRK